MEAIQMPPGSKQKFRDWNEPSICSESDGQVWGNLHKDLKYLTIGELVEWGTYKKPHKI